MHIFFPFFFPSTIGYETKTRFTAFVCLLHKGQATWSEILVTFARQKQTQRYNANRLLAWLHGVKKRRTSRVRRLALSVGRLDKLVFIKIKAWDRKVEFSYVVNS